MSNWIDFDMLMSEISLHRSNAQRRVLAYREKENPTEWDKLECKEAVGEETILMCLEGWCNDFKFSTEELMELDEFKKKMEEGV